MSSYLAAVQTAGRMPPVPADAFIAAVCRRDFGAIGRLLTPDARMRAVLPSGYLEAIGDEVVASFARWFATPERFEMIAVGSEDVLGRARVQWRFRVAPHPTTGARGWHEIEQLAYCETSAGLITRIDLISSGYRLLPPTCGQY